MNFAPRLENIRQASLPLFGPPSRSRVIKVSFGNIAQLTTWDDEFAHISIPWDSQANDIAIAFHLAHEYVHTLDPTPNGSASVLEEGVATYFQHWYVVHSVATSPSEKEMWRYPNEKDPAYKHAYELVAPIFQSSPLIFRSLRQSGFALSNITAQALKERVHMSHQSATALTSKFQR